MDRLVCAMAGGLGISTGTTDTARTELLVVALVSSSRSVSDVTDSSSLENLAR